MPTVAFNICCPRDCVSRHNGGTAGAPIMLRDAASRTANVERNGGQKWVKGGGGIQLGPARCRERKASQAAVRLIEAEIPPVEITLKVLT